MEAKEGQRSHIASIEINGIRTTMIDLISQFGVEFYENLLKSKGHIDQKALEALELTTHGQEQKGMYISFMEEIKNLVGGMNKEGATSLNGSSIRFFQETQDIIGGCV